MICHVHVWICPSARTTSDPVSQGGQIWHSSGGPEGTVLLKSGRGVEESQAECPLVLC